MARTQRTGTALTDWIHLTAATEATDLFLGAGGDGATGSAFDDLIRGQDGNDQLWGAAGNDTLTGDAGNDMLWGGEGADSLDGGAGADMIWGGAGNDTLALGEGDDQAWGEDGDDRIATGGGNDTVFSGQGDDRVDGGAGNDQLSGEAGNDTLIAGEGRNTVWGAEGNDSLTAGAGDDSLTGDAGDDIIAAGAGNNTVWGGDGADSLTAGAGQDVLGTGEGNDTVSAGAGNDVVWGNGGDDLLDLGSGNDLATGDMGNDTILGGDGNDTVFGGEGADRIVAGAGADRVNADGGDDTVVHGGGAAGDLFDGGAGFDTLVLDLTGAEWTDALRAEVAAFRSHLTATPWADFTFASQALTVRGFEAVSVLVDGADPTAGLRLTGTAAADLLTGGANHDTLIGLDGADTLIGNAGNDVLDGSGDAVVVTTTTTTETGSLLPDFRAAVQANGGAATLLFTLDGSGGFGTTAMGRMDATGDGVADGWVLRVNAHATGLLDVNRFNVGLALDDYAVTAGKQYYFYLPGTGSATMVSTLAGASNTKSMGSNDFNWTGTRTVTTTVTTQASDRMEGGAGDDTYIVDGAGDQVIEAAGAGRDTVRSSVSYTLPAHVEVLELTGSALSGTGNALDNTLSGNALDNTLTGGAGADRFLFGPGGGIDTVTDFEVGVDTLVVQGATGPAAASLVGDVLTLDFGGFGIRLLGIDAAERQAIADAYDWL